MLNKFHNFVLESQTTPMSSKYESYPSIDVRSLYNSYFENNELVANELNRKLINREIKIKEMMYIEKKNLFEWRYITPKFFKFDGVYRIKNKYYINFNDGCLFELSQSLIIEHRLLLFDNKN